MNALSFGIRVLEAAGRAPDNLTVRGIAVAVSTFAVLLHGTWRQAGLLLNNVFAMVKILMLLLIIITGLIAWGGVFGNEQAASRNLSSKNAFKDTADDPYAIAESFLAVLFTYGGFNQANYVSILPVVEHRRLALIMITGDWRDRSSQEKIQVACILCCGRTMCAVHTCQHCIRKRSVTDFRTILG
jgi:amino acid transporter